MMQKISIGSRPIYLWQNSYHVSIDPAVFSAIDHAIADQMHPHPLFPKVHAIIFHESHLTTAWHLMSLMTATITSLEINIEQTQDIDGGSLGMQTVLASMQTRCPSLNNFKIACNQSNAMDELLSHFTHGLLGMQALTHLDISAFLIYTPTLIEISSIPHLKHLSFNVNGLNMHDIPSNIHFPTLFECNIYGKQKNTALEFIKALTTSSFIQLDIFFDLPFTPDDIHQILTSLLPCQFTIKHINIQWWLDPDRGITLDDSDYISGITLAPLLEFSHLKNVELNTLSSLHGIDDTFISKLALSCPNLVHLDLGSRGAVNFPMDTTLASLVILANHCRLLQNIGLYFDCCTIQSWVTKDLQCNNAITQLSVGCSTIQTSNINTMANFLSKLFPNLTRIDFRWNSNDVDSDDDAIASSSENSQQVHHCWDLVLTRVKSYRD